MTVEVPVFYLFTLSFDMHSLKIRVSSHLMVN